MKLIFADAEDEGMKKVRIPRSTLLPGDIILCVLIAVIVLFVFSAGFFLSSEGKYVNITSDGGVQRYPIFENREVELESNGYALTVRIENGSAYVESSDCPDKICVNTGKITKAGESVICVPAHVSVTVEGESEADYALG